MPAELAAPADQERRELRRHRRELGQRAHVPGREQHAEAVRVGRHHHAGPRDPAHESEDGDHQTGRRQQPVPGVHPVRQSPPRGLRLCHGSGAAEPGAARDTGGPGSHGDARNGRDRQPDVRVPLHVRPQIPAHPHHPGVRPGGDHRVQGAGGAGGPAHDVRARDLHQRPRGLPAGRPVRLQIQGGGGDPAGLQRDEQRLPHGGAQGRVRRGVHGVRVEARRHAAAGERADAVPAVPARPELDLQQFQPEGGARLRAEHPAQPGADGHVRDLHVGRAVHQVLVLQQPALPQAAGARRQVLQAEGRGQHPGGRAAGVADRAGRAGQGHPPVVLQHEQVHWEALRGRPVRRFDRVQGGFPPAGVPQGQHHVHQVPIGQPLDARHVQPVRGVRRGLHGPGGRRARIHLLGLHQGGQLRVPAVQRPRDPPQVQAGPQAARHAPGGAAQTLRRAVRIQPVPPPAAGGLGGMHARPGAPRRLRRGAGRVPQGDARDHAGRVSAVRRDGKVHRGAQPVREQHVVDPRGLQGRDLRERQPPVARGLCALRVPADQRVGHRRPPDRGRGAPRQRDRRHVQHHAGRADSLRAAGGWQVRQRQGQEPAGRTPGVGVGRRAAGRHAEG